MRGEKRARGETSKTQCGEMDDNTPFRDVLIFCCHPPPDL